MITLFKHQHEAIIKANTSHSFAYFLETGTGKTIVALTEMVFLKQINQISATIVTAPKTVLRPVWLKELEKFSDQLDYFVFQWVGTISDHHSVILNNALRLDSDPSRMPIFLINIEAFSHRRIYELVTRVLKRWKTLWIMDESTTIKSPNTKRTKGILAISHWAEYKRILSGYPVLKSPEDLYSQICFLGPNLIPQRSFFAFRNQFCILQKLDNRVSITKGPKNVEELNKEIQPFSIRILKKDCLDLPEKLRTIRYVEMTDEQRRAYNDMKDRGFVEIKQAKQEDEFVFASTLLTQLGKLHQIANGMILGIPARPQELDCYKYDILLDFLKNEVPDQQVVIWSSYVHTLYKIQEFIRKDMSCRVIRGAGQEANQIEEDFITGKIQGLICNPAGFRFGHNWTNAAFAIYFNNSFSLEHRIQSEDRLHRIGQRNPVTYIDLVTDNTIEEKILQTLELNHSVGASILKDEWEAWFS